MRKIRKVSILIIFLFSFLFVYYVQYIARQYESHSKKARSLQLFIESNKDIYEIGDKIDITSKIKNISNNKINLEVLLAFYLTSKDQQVWIWGPAILKNNDIASNKISELTTISLNPFEDKVFTYNLYDVKWRGPTSFQSLNSFIVPGRYNLNLEMFVGGNKLRGENSERLVSNIITIEVSKNRVRIIK